MSEGSDAHGIHAPMFVTHAACSKSSLAYPRPSSAYPRPSSAYPKPGSDSYWLGWFLIFTKNCNLVLEFFENYNLVPKFFENYNWVPLFLKIIIWSLKFLKITIQSLYFFKKIAIWPPLTEHAKALTGSWKRFWALFGAYNIPLCSYLNYLQFGIYCTCLIYLML